MEIPGTENTPELTPDARHHGQGGEEKICHVHPPLWYFFRLREKFNITVRMRSLHN